MIFTEIKGPNLTLY